MIQKKLLESIEFTQACIKTIEKEFQEFNEKIIELFDDALKMAQMRQTKYEKLLKEIEYSIGTEQLHEIDLLLETELSFSFNLDKIIGLFIENVYTDSIIKESLIGKTRTLEEVQYLDRIRYGICLELKYDLKSFTISKDYNFIVSIDKALVKLWNLNNKQDVEDIDIPGANCVKIASNNNFFVCGCLNHTVQLYDIINREFTNSIKRHKGSVNCITIANDNKYIISGSSDKNIIIWKIGQNKVKRKLKGHRGEVTSVCITLDDNLIVSGSTDNTIKVWRFFKWELLWTFDGHINQVTSVAITDDGAFIVSGSHDNTVKVWNIQRGYKEFELNGHRKSVNCIALSKNYEWIISGSSDNTIKLWKPSDHRIFDILQYKNSIIGVEISDDCQFIVYGSKDNTIRIRYVHLS